MEKETGIVEEARVLERLQTEYDIGSSETEWLIVQILKEGTLFSPRNGYVKKT